MKKAGDNENDFKQKMGHDKNNNRNIQDKLVFGKRSDANISVDGYFIYNDKLYLLEIDSGNEAKLLAGQYILLDALYDQNQYKKFAKKECVFLVIHYFDKYNPERTEKTLMMLKDKFKTTINFMAFHISDINDWNDLLNKIDSKNR